MKKIWQTILAISAACLMLGILAVAAEVPSLEVVTTGQEAKAGETVTAEISINHNPGVAAIFFHIDYDKTRLELVGYEGQQLTGWTVGIGGGENAVWVASKNRSENGNCLKLKFRVLESATNGAATIGIKDLELLNIDEEAIKATTVAGEVKVIGSPTSGDEGTSTGRDNKAGDGGVNPVVPAEKPVGGQTEMTPGSSASEGAQNERQTDCTSHVFVDGVCVICGYKLPAEETFDPVTPPKQPEEELPATTNPTIWYVTASVVVVIIGIVIATQRKKNKVA